MENNTEVRRDTYITPIRDSAVSAKAAEKIEAAEEYDLVASLLAAAEYQKTPDMIQEVEIKRKGRVFFTVHLHPVSEDDITLASKKASKYYENPRERSCPESEEKWTPTCSIPGLFIWRPQKRTERKSGATDRSWRRLPQ